MPEKRDTSNDVGMKADDLRQWMRSHGYDADKLADRLGLTKQAVVYWLHGKREIPEPIGRLLNYFDIRPELFKDF